MLQRPAIYEPKRSADVPETSSLHQRFAERAIVCQRNVQFGRPPKLTDALIRQVLLAHDDPATTVPETCRVLGISKSSYYAALRAGRSEFRQEAA